jgi:chromosome partitioning protein
VRITAIVNSKGGTTKTTTAVNLATAAALRGKRVTLIDLDDQGSATQWLGYSPDNDALMDALLRGSSLDPITVSTSVTGLDLVPASVLLADTSRLQAEPGNNTLLRNALRKTQPRDWVFIDSPGDHGHGAVSGHGRARARTGRLHGVGRAAQGDGADH